MLQYFIEFVTEGNPIHNNYVIWKKAPLLSLFKPIALKLPSEGEDVN